jgi:DNA-binding NarL/FixJ family response regulator
MNERGNGQLPLAKPTVRNRISSERWEQIKTAHASGIGLREIARNMGISEGTVLAHAKREGWSPQNGNHKPVQVFETNA